MNQDGILNVSFAHSVSQRLKYWKPKQWHLFWFYEKVVNGDSIMRYVGVSIWKMVKY